MDLVKDNIHDNEDRSLQIELLLQLDIKAYEEKEQDIIEDIYCPTGEVKKHTNEAIFRKLLIRNNSKCKVNEKVKVNPSYKMLQICNCTGEAKIEDISTTEEGIEVNGVLMLNTFYVTADDKMPMSCIKSVIPFNHNIQIKGISDYDRFGDMAESGIDIEYQMNVNLEQLQASMNGQNEIEVKAVIGLDAICFASVKKKILDDIEVTMIEANEYYKFPGIVGYITKREDTLWNIAKKYHTTVEEIKNLNKNVMEKKPSDTLRFGEKLVLMKMGK